MLCPGGGGGLRRTSNEPGVKAHQIFEGIKGMVEEEVVMGLTGSVKVTDQIDKIMRGGIGNPPCMYLVPHDVLYIWV